MTGAQYYAKRAQREANVLNKRRFGKLTLGPAVVPPTPPTPPEDGSLLEVSMTTLQFEAYKYMLVFRDTFGFIPTYEEMARFFNVTPATIRDRIWYLQSVGAVRVVPKKSRAIVIVEAVKITIRPSHRTSRADYKKPA